MSGGAYDYVAAYVNNGSSSLNNGSSLVSAPNYMKDVYEMGAGDTREANYATNAGKYGDAVYETSTNGNATSSSWHGDYSYFPTSRYSFFIRGGDYNIWSNAGAFCFNHDYGSAAGYASFRPVLVSQ